MNSTNLELSSIAFFGRPYSELLKCFGLEESELLGKSVLECPSGPSSFVVEANARGIRATGVDPLFYRSPHAVRVLAESDFRLMFSKVREASERFVERTYQSIDEAEAIRWNGLQRFVEDYCVGRAQGRYLEGRLPYLDFEDRSFDCVLCGHLLFVYADRLDLDFHLRAIGEMCRVASDEVRLHPLVDISNDLYAHLDKVIEFAKNAGFRSEIREVDHEFFRGTGHTLILKRIIS